MYADYRGQISLKGFTRLVDQPYWRLRDYLQRHASREHRDRVHAHYAAEIEAVATEEPTYGYRRVYKRLVDKGVEIGCEKVRRLMGELGLQPLPPRKKQRAKNPVVAEVDWPAGRRLQIDATRFRLEGGVAWVYLVEDVNTRQCLAASVAPNLSQERAAATLLEGHQHLTALGLIEPRLVQSDGGSDFTAGYFQQVCEQLGRWVRCRVAQVGGMGILERLNRTFKHEFVFRYEVNTLVDLEALLPSIMQWCNERQLHSSLGYVRQRLLWLTNWRRYSLEP